MQALFAAGALGLLALAIFLILGPVIAGIFALVALLMLLAISLPVLILLLPWIIIGGFIWLVFF